MLHQVSYNMYFYMQSTSILVQQRDFVLLCFAIDAGADAAALVFYVAMLPIFLSKPCPNKIFVRKIIA